MARVISNADLLALRTGYEMQRGISEKAYVPQLEGMMRHKVSKNKREAHPIHSLSQEMTRWNGSRTYTDLMTKVVYLENQKPWQIATAIEMSDLELGTDIDLELIAAKHGKAAAARKDQLIKTVLQSGATTAWCDGVNFFSTTHPTNFKPGNTDVWVNLYTTTALTPANFETVYEAMNSNVDWDGQPINFEPGGWSLYVPTALQAQGQRIVEQEYTVDNIVGGSTNTGGNTNINYKKAKLVVSSLLNNEPTVWYLVYTADVIKPIVGQTWREVRSRQKGIGSDENFDTDQIHLGVDTGVEAVGYEAHYIARCAA